MSLTLLEWVLIGLAVFEALIIWILLWQIPLHDGQNTVDLKPTASGPAHGVVTKVTREVERQDPIDRLGAGRY